jgi:hypothetical protein
MWLPISSLSLISVPCSQRHELESSATVGWWMVDGGEERRDNEMLHQFCHWRQLKLNLPGKQ